MESKKDEKFSSSNEKKNDTKLELKVMINFFINRNHPY